MTMIRRTLPPMTDLDRARLNWEAATDTACWDLIGCSMWDLAVVATSGVEPGAPLALASNPLLSDLYAEGLTPVQAAERINDLSRAPASHGHDDDRADMGAMFAEGGRGCP